MAKPLASGIYGLIGAPGSGKSYKAVREIAYSACTAERPIYTNVPIVPKRLRAYIYRKLPRSIKGHAARRRRANLVKSISKAHFDRFCHRLALIDETAEEVLNEWGDRHDIGELAEFRQTEARTEAIRRVAAEHGDPVLTGVHANWIPPGSVLFLDELHKWYPSKGYKDEAKAILDFTSMHRHMQLKVIVISQRWMNVSLSFRSMAREVWYCMNYSKRPILGFLKFDRWINIFRYVHYNGEDIEERSGLPRPGAQPVWSEMVWPEWNGGVEYGLYRSYSHAGTLEEQEAEIKAVTAAMMGDTTTQAKTQENEEPSEMPKKATMATRLNKFIMTMGIFGIAFSLGRCTSPAEPDTKPVTEQRLIELMEEKKAEKTTENDTATPIASGATTPAAQTNMPAPWAEKRISSMAANWIMIEGRKYEVGQAYEDLLLLAVDATAGDSVWISRTSVVYRWRIGGNPRPGRLPDAVRDAWLSAAADARDRNRPAPATETPADLDAP